jgi:hypothetical protein
MRIIIALSILLFFSCNKKQPQNYKQELDVPDTQMAEILPSKKISAQDSIALMKAFKTLYQALNNQDGNLMEQLSTDKKRWPSSLNEMLQLPPVFPAFLINNPIKNLYNPDILDAMKNNNTKIYNNYAFYCVEFITKHTSRKLITKTGHSFRFIKIDDAFRFSAYDHFETAIQNIENHLDSSSLYFPLKRSKQELNDSLFLDMYSNKWYSLLLKNCDEPVLYNYKGEGEIYRFIWLRSFDFPVIVRLQKEGLNITVTTKVLKERYDEYPDEVEVNTSKTFNFFKWMNFKSGISTANFWNLDSKDGSPQDNDGAMWILEGIKDGKYHVVERQSAGHSNFGKACLYLIKFSNLNITEDKIY